MKGDEYKVAISFHCCEVKGCDQWFDTICSGPRIKTRDQTWIEASFTAREMHAYQVNNTYFNDCASVDC